MASSQTSGFSESLDRDACALAAVLAVILLPLSDALNFLGKLANTWRAFGEKLRNIWSASSSMALLMFSGAHPSNPSNDGRQGQQQGQVQYQKKHPNHLEFSIAEFLAARVKHQKGPKSSMPDTFSFHVSVDDKVTSRAATAEQSPTGADSSPSGLMSSLRGCFFAGGNGRDLRVTRLPQPQSKGLPQSKRSRSTDKTLVLDLDETLVRTRRELTPDDRFDFIVTLPPKHQMLDPHKLAGNLALSPRGKSAGRFLLGDDGVAPDTGATAASWFMKMKKSNVWSGKPRTSYGSRNGRRIYVEKRPYLQKFLEIVSCQFEIVVFTAARADYANAVLEEIDPGRQMVDHILSRENCTRLSKVRYGDSKREARSSWFWRRGGRNAAGSRSKHGSTMVKDLGILGRPLSKVIMVENSLAAIRYHLENAVHIPSFYGGREDTELLCTLEQLQPLIKAVDVRDEIIRRYVQTQAMKEGYDMSTEEKTEF